MDTVVTVNGRQFHLTSEDVAAKLRDTEPDALRTHVVTIGERKYPVKQAFAEATGLDRSEFISHQARRALQNLGFIIETIAPPRAQQDFRPRPARTPATHATPPTPRGSTPENTMRLFRTRCAIEEALLGLSSAELEALVARHCPTGTTGGDLSRMARAHTLALSILEPLIAE